MSFWGADNDANISPYFVQMLSIVKFDHVDDYSLFIPDSSPH